MSAFSKFIRTATPEEKAEVYLRVIDRANERQRNAMSTPDMEAFIARLPKPQVFKVGDKVGIYVGDHQGELTPGIVVAVLNLEGWAFPHYVVECEVGAPDPLLEVRDGLLGMRMWESVLGRDDGSFAACDNGHAPVGLELESGALICPTCKVLHRPSLMAGVAAFYGDCAKCGQPVFPPMDRHSETPVIDGDKIFHGGCFMRATR